SVWSLIMECYLRYRKLRPDLKEKSTFKMPGGILMSYVVLAFILFTLVILALEPDTLKALYVSTVWLVILGVTYHVFYKPRMKKL
ncbi:amino acid transporter, partial [Acinetobacter nosocomialis]